MLTVGEFTAYVLEERKWKSTQQLNVGDKFEFLVAEAGYGVYSVLWIELPIF